MGIIPSQRRGNRGSGRSRDRPEVTGLRHGGELNSGSETLWSRPKTSTPICLGHSPGQEGAEVEPGFRMGLPPLPPSSRRCY